MTAAITIKKAAEVYRAELPASPFFQHVTNLAGLKNTTLNRKNPTWEALIFTPPVNLFKTEDFYRFSLLE